MEEDKTIKYKIKVETLGFEEAQTEIEELARAYDGFPAQVTIRNCSGCTINIYANQTKIQEQAGSDGVIHEDLS